MSRQDFVTDCLYNLSIDDRIDFFKRRQGLRLDRVFLSYWGWMTLPFALFGFLVTLLFIVIVYRAIKQRRVSRKCYILLLNRAIGDLLACIAALATCVYVFVTLDVNREVVTLLTSFFVGCFWSAMVSYTSLSLLKLLAVSRPFEYRKWVTMKRCIYLIVGSWVMFLIITSYTLLISAVVKIPYLSEKTGCKMETCVRTMYRYRNALTVFVYFFTLVVFGITVLLIKMAQRFQASVSNDGGRYKANRFPLWKLALNVLTFACLYLFFVVWCIGLLVNQNNCLFMRNFTELVRVFAFVRCSILLRICVDPLLSFVTDLQIRRGFLQLLGVQRKLTFSSARSIFQRSSAVEDISSEGAPPRDRSTGRYSLPAIWARTTQERKQ